MKILKKILERIFKRENAGEEKKNFPVIATISGEAQRLIKLRRQGIYGNGLAKSL